MIEERDIFVAMRDGTRLVLDVYRPDEAGRYPVLYAAALHNKDMQGPDVADVLPPQPAHAPLWFGPLEAGNTRLLVANGYAHVIAQPRGSGKSEGHYGHEDTDHYDTIEWITHQPWCDGNVGMVGISGYAGEQWRAAEQGHPALKAIFPYDACSAYGGMFGFRDFYPGGVLHTFPYLLDVFSTVHEARGVPEALLPEQEELWKAAMANPDLKMYQNLFNILTQKGQRTFIMFLSMIAPWETEDAIERAEARFRKIKIPFYTGSGAYAYTYKLHWLGAQNYFRSIDAPKKLLFAGPAHLERPFHQLHDEIIRWYDHWLKGIDNGVMHGEPVRYWLMGANEWRTAADWPLPDTKWVRFYLCDWGRLSEDEPVAAGLAGAAAFEPDVFTQMPLKKTTKVERLRYMTDPLPRDLQVVGPISLTIYAAIDKEDTNWIVILKDIGPDVSVQTAREGERSPPADLHERELTRGWLKASYRAVDENRSKPGAPFHKLTQSSIEPVKPGEVYEYKIQILATANLFKAGHRICLDITSMDVPTGTGAMTDVEYIPYHICRSETVTHQIHHDAQRPSHLLLPVISNCQSSASKEVCFMKTIRFERQGSIGRIVLANPPYNRLDLQFSHCLREAVHEASSSDIRALVVSSEGEDFSFGGGVREWPGKHIDWFRTFVAEVNASYRALEILRVPTVAAVRGAAFGGGFELALSCDFLVAADNAVFRCVEVTTGFIPIAGGLQRLAERVGRSRASRFAMLGEPISGALAGNLGIATHVVASSMVEGTAAELAATLANGPTKAYAAVRTLLKAWSAGGVPAADAVMLDITMPLHATEDVTRGFVNTAKAFDKNIEPPAMIFHGR